MFVILAYVTISINICSKSKTISDKSALAEISWIILIVFYHISSLTLLVQFFCHKVATNALLNNGFFSYQLSIIVILRKWMTKKEQEGPNFLIKSVLTNSYWLKKPYENKNKRQNLMHSTIRSKKKTEFIIMNNYYLKSKIKIS